MARCHAMAKRLQIKNSPPISPFGEFFAASSGDLLLLGSVPVQGAPLGFHHLPHLTPSVFFPEQLPSLICAERARSEVVQELVEGRIKVTSLASIRSGREFLAATYRPRIGSFLGKKSDPNLAFGF
jgi:hypothetical protein